MYKKIFVAITLLCAIVNVKAQEAAKEESKPITISGYIDGYYRYDFSKKLENNRTSFTNAHNSFELGMASLKLEHSFGKVGFVADLGFGQRAKEFSYNDNGITQAVKQLYATYAPADWIKFTLGSWGTHVGYEIVDPIANRNYSMSYMFSWGPFFHTGLKTDFTFGKSGLMIGIANPTDYKTAPLNSKKYFIGQYSLAATDDIKLYLNYVAGKRFTDSAKTSQIDLVVTAKITDKFNIGYNGTINSTKFQESADVYASSSKKWWGSAVYLNVDPTEKVGLTLRSEYFSDKNQLVAMSLAPEGANIFANTLSLNLKSGPLTIIPELRIESANKPVYYNAEGNTVSSTASFLLAAVYKF